MGMLQSSRSINQLITAEVDSGIEPGRIVLGGFSQGATMSLLTGLTGERKLAGITVLSGWLPLKNKFKAVCDSSYSHILGIDQAIRRWHLHMPHQFLFFGVVAQWILWSNSKLAMTRRISW